MLRADHNQAHGITWSADSTIVAKMSASHNTQMVVFLASGFPAVASRLRRSHPRGLYVSYSTQKGDNASNRCAKTMHK
jgi:hypothetical protein